MTNKKPKQDGYQPRLERLGDQPTNKIERGYQPKPIPIEQGDSKPPRGGPGIKPPQR